MNTTIESESYSFATIPSVSESSLQKTDAYVINLERDLQKKQHLEQNIQEKSIDTHLNVIFKKAVDGSDPSALSKYSFNICPTWFDPHLKTGIRTGEIGCALSHYDCWLDFYNSNKPHALFLEDDVMFTDNFTEQYNNLLQYPDNTDIVYIKRKPLNADKETKYNSIFINSKTSWWLCGYFLTRKGVEQLLNANYLQNLIVVDDFLPMLYDSDYLQQYKKYYNDDIHLTAYSLVDSFIQLVDGTFLESSTFHSNYYEFESTFFALVSYKNCSMSSIDRFEYSCKKMSVNYKIFDDVDQIVDNINDIDDNKIMMLIDPNHAFILNNPRIIYCKSEETVYSNFNNKQEFLDKFQSGELVFYGKNKYLKHILRTPSAPFGNYGVQSLTSDFYLHKYGSLQPVDFVHNCITCLDDYDKNQIITILPYSDNQEYSVVEVNSIFIYGKDNHFLLNNYENYFLRKISKCYGFKMNHSSIATYTKKVRINVMIYSNIYKQMLSYLEKIDYDAKLLDIYIYTDSLNDTLLFGASRLFAFGEPLGYYVPAESTAQQGGGERLNSVAKAKEFDVGPNKYNVIYLSELDAYNQVYSYYNDYDYVWFLKSDYVISESSLLKDCIFLGKTISSGLIQKNNELLSNFWGNLDKNGYYKRSTDYIDILNRNVINVWNVPYITGNILFQSKIFRHQNLFVHSKYKDIDMALCANVRDKNEFMYLFNQKKYGNIVQKSDIVLQPSTIDWTEDKILHPDFYDFLYNNNTNIFSEIGPDIWSIPFFTPEFCKHLIELSEEKGEWSAGVYADPNQTDTRVGKIEEIPTQDIHLKQLGLHDFWTNVTNKYMKKVLSHLYKYLTKDYHIAFVVKYDASPGGQKSLKPHHDSSVYTINVALNNHTEYEGGGVRFLSKNVTYLNKTAGYMLLHPGRITHYHEALQITGGKRYILVSFNN